MNDKINDNPREKLDEFAARMYKSVDVHVLNLEGDDTHCSAIICSRKGLYYSSNVQTDAGYRSSSRNFSWDHLCEIANTLGIKLKIEE